MLYLFKSVIILYISSYKLGVETTDTAYLPLSKSPEWQSRHVLNSKDSNDLSDNDKTDLSVDGFDHDHVLLPWSCCIPVVLEEFSSKAR